MAVAAAQTTQGRHPWLAAVIAAPEAELRALVGGYADVAPYGRAEPADAAASLLFGLSEDDPAHRAFDQGCLELLEHLRAAMLGADAALYQRHLGTLDRLVAVIRRIRPANTARDLHRRYTHWFRIVETAIVDRGLDLRREFWRALALTQDVLQGSAAPRRLMALWFDLCAEAGPLGRYDASYLDVGLVGLRRLPLGHNDDSNEEAVCHGIARWAARQRPDQRTFLARWREIESAYPRAPTYWPPLVADVIAATEEYLAAEQQRRPKSFQAAEWWREELEIHPKAREPAQRRPHYAANAAPASEHDWRAVLDKLGDPVAAVRTRIDALMRKQHRYADATGDTYYLVRTVCNVGMRLLRENLADRAARGAVAATLARAALGYEPANVFAWALWRDALAAQGAPEAAEQVGWEALRRYPENPQWRTQLATLLDRDLGRTPEAVRLLSETVALFPLNPVARPQLATLLADRLDRPEDAAAVLREAIVIAPDHPHSYGQLATLLADRLGDWQGAIEAARQAQRLEPNNEATRRLVARLQARRSLPARGHPPAPTPRIAFGQSIDLGIDLLPGRARRALFRFETADDADRAAALAEVSRLFDEDPSLAYARYVAQRTGAISTDPLRDSAFAFAFDRAAREGSAPAFEALLRHAFGMDTYLAGAGMVLLSNAATFTVPPAANDLEAGALARRFAILTGEISTALQRPNADRAAFLRLLSDFAAAELSSGVAI